MRRYEGMFLFDPAVTRDWATMQAEVRRLCDRIGAELLVCVKFDERKLAYEINKRKRGTYVLAYFDAPPQRIADLERDVRLSELILRALVLRADKITDQRLAELRAHPPDVALAPSGGDGRRHEDDRRAHERRGEGREAKRAAPAEPAEAGTEPAGAGEVPLESSEAGTAEA